LISLVRPKYYILLPAIPKLNQLVVALLLSRANAVASSDGFQLLLAGTNGMGFGSFPA
jgi:hypothetical protein